MEDTADGSALPIAIVGIGCRMPGGVRCPEDFWAVIREGKDTITEVPPDRWSLDNFYHPDQTKQGKIVTRKGGFIDGIDKFDNSFFKMSPREAAALDPQHRILLEVVHEAFEDAGILSDKLEASAGVYVAIGLHDYSIQTISEISLINPYTLTGMAHSTAANRISYAFDLRGPSYAVDTACASFITATHLACNGLLNGECQTAVVAACNALITPETSVAFTALGALSKSGKCCPFSKTAEGYVRSEGFGAIILKTVEKAKQDGDHIYAVVRGSAIAANGFSSSLTMPSSKAQEYVMRRAFQRSGIPVGDVHYVEAHGTGTPVGDPIEAEAIGKTFTADRVEPLRIGSAKGNFGHNECASGITAIIKAALMLDHNLLCPTINFTEINPKIEDAGWNLLVQTELEEMPPPEPEKTIKIGVNSTGFGGAVGHVVLEASPGFPPKDETPNRSSGWTFGGDCTGHPIIVPLSAKSKEALADVAGQWREFSSDRDALQVVSWLSTRRRHHGCRLAVVSDSGEAFRKQMDHFLESGGGGEVSVGASGKTAKICFVFPGQGQQWENMGRRLFLKETVFREAVKQCDSMFKQLSSWSLLYDRHVFFTDDTAPEPPDVDMDDPRVLQPAILFFQIGLLQLLQSWGVQPDAVVGHSLGEVAAAYASGGLTLPEAVSVIYHRSHQEATLEGSGSMAALRLSLPEATNLCQKYEDVYVAAVNAPKGITISGDTEAISQITLDDPTKAKRLRVECAFHTSFMDPIEAPFRAAMADAVSTEPGSGLIPFYSTTTGQLYRGKFDTEYWWENIRGIVKFQGAVEEMLQETDIDVFVEIAASATLLSSVNQTYRQFNSETSCKLIPTGQREQDDYLTLLRALGKMYVAGCTIEWGNVTSENASWIRLPTYPWQHQSFWLEGDERRKRRLGLDDRTFKGQAGNITLEMFPFLADHIVQERPVFPGAGFVEMMVQCAFGENERPALSKVSFHKLLAWVLTGNGHSKPLGLECHREGPNLKVTSEGVSCSSAKIETCPESVEPLSTEDILSRCGNRITAASIYQKLAGLTLQYGPAFQIIESAALGDGEAIGLLRPTTDPKQRIQLVHVDGCLQLLLIATGSNTTLYLPVSIKMIRMYVTSLPVSEVLVAYARVTELNSSETVGDISLSLRDGTVLFTAEGCVCQNITGTNTGVSLDSCLYATKMQSAHASLPATSLAYDKFGEGHLQAAFPDEMESIARVEFWMPTLQKACAFYIHQALTSVEEEQIDESQIRYFKRLKQISDKTNSDDVSGKDVELMLNTVHTELPEFRREVNMLQSLGRNLPQTLKNQAFKQPIPPAQSTIDEVLEDSAMTRIYNKAGADIILSAVKDVLGRKQIVRVLEVEGEHGSLAKYVLPSLREVCEETRVEYILGFSGSYPQNQLFDEFGFVKHQQFDLDSDVVHWGIVPASFDIIICMDNLHSSVDLSRSLGTIHKLLLRGGWLFMCELTNVSCIADVLFGGTPRCWLFEDFRQDSCWLSQNGWKDALRKSGFKDAVALSTPHEFFYSILVCCKPSGDLKAPTPGQARPPNSLLVLGQEAANALILPSSLCEKLNVDGEIIRLDGTDQENLLSKFPKTQEGNLICLYYNSEGSFCQLVKLLQLIDSDVLNFRRVFVVTSGAKTDTSEAVGLCRAVTNETRTPVYSVHMNDSHNESVESLLTLVNGEHSWDREITINRGEVAVPRITRVRSHRSSDTVDGRHWQLAVNQNGKSTSIEDLCFIPLEELEPLAGQVVIKIKSCALNFKDVMVSLGLLDGLTDAIQDVQHIGLECSGTIEKVGDGVESFAVGDEVVGFGKHCFASHTICEAELMAHKPSNIAWDEAACLCVIFCASYFSLVTRANLQKNETVLIHSACGGVGLAALQVAKMVGARVICSAGSDHKRSYLKNHLGVEMVTDSHSVRFYDDVMAWTDGLGVNVVLNSLHGEKLSKGIETLAPGGRFCEIGKRDILQNTSLQMSLLLENKSFMSCQIDRMLINQKAAAHQLVEEVMSLFGENGPLVPIPMKTFSLEDFQEAFSIMAKGDHIGKMVFSIPPEYKPSKLLPSSRIFDSNATYVVTGGYGGLGMAFARWLSNRGVRYIALASRRGCSTSAARQTVSYLKKRKTTVFDFALDVSKASDVQSLLSGLKDAPVVKGIFHLAGCIMDESLSTLNPEIVSQITGAKASGARNLHNLTQHLPLEVFFLLSSFTTIWGHSSQPCYTAANSFLDSLAEERRAGGLPAVSLQLGCVRGAGFLESNMDKLDTLAVKGSFTLHIDEVLQIVERIVQSKDTPAVICLSNQDWDKTLQFCHKGHLRFRHLTKAARPRRSVCVTAEHREQIEERVRQKMARLLCVDPDGIDLGQPMVNYGVDSLMAVEMVAWSSKEFNVAITQVDILGGITTDEFLKRVLLGQTE